MKILHTVELYHPSVGGSQEVVRQLSERLVRLGHDVTVATTDLPERNFKVYNGVKIEEFNIWGSEVTGFSGEVESYKQFLLESNFDIIMNYGAQQWATDLMLPILDKISAKKVIVPCGFSGLYLSKYGKYFEKMKSLLRQYDSCVYLSNNYRDINFARKYGAAENCIIIPNGAALDEFELKPNIEIRAALNIPKDHFLIMHVGSHTGMKGHKEAIKIFKKAKIKHSTFLIVANSFGGGCIRRCLLAEKLYKYSPFSKLSDKKIVITFLTREETVAAYHEADLFLFPSNVECSPIVLFEAIASKTPFLVTDVGHSKEIIEWTNGGELLPTLKRANGFVKADVNKSVKTLENIFNDKGKRQFLSVNGYNSWKNSFTWELIAKRYEALYLKLIDDNK
ncbi:MAG: glycosyltransferase family 4 protein [Methanosarcina mazei]|nr:glycosyltransferase family 4 protein [Methanosarcina mazei]